MAAITDHLADLSPSSRRAVQWARAAAAHRQASASGATNPPSPAPPSSPTPALVDPEDLLVGVLLAHPDERGEGRVLLAHFGLTARDVLSETYPRLPVAELRQRAAEVQPDLDPPLGPETISVLNAARQLGRGHASLSHLLGALLQLGQPFRWMQVFASRGTEWTLVLESYRRWLDSGQRSPGSSSAQTPGTTDGLVAGESLRQWLARENPRRPVDLPAYASDQADAARDLIGIQTEADAFAYLIASCDLKPPLAIGLFGDWGSGKSFLMRSIDQRLLSLKALVDGENQAAVRVWKNIVRIEFNAWEYVQGNLWAGLLERIFGELGSLRPRLVESWRAPVVSDLAGVEETVADVDSRLEVAGAEQDIRRQQVADAEKAADEARAAAQDRADQTRDRVARQRARQALRELWGWLPVLLLDRRGADLVVALKDAKAELARGNAVLGSYWRRPLHVVLVSLGAMLVPLVSLLLARAEAPPVVSALGGLAAIVPVLTSTLSMATRWGRERLADLESAEAEVQAEILKPVQEAEKALDEARVALADAEQRLGSTERERRRAEERRQQLLARLTELTPGRILVDFADQRSTEYGRRLGLLAQVRRDLTVLEREIVANNDALRAPIPPATGRFSAAPDGGKPKRDVPNRIVLYIDDLDRCPPAKVLEVLEAVHLLLSFEMFVVLVAVDSRWLTSALTDRVVALRPASAVTGQPTPKDYLEKIFQLPFWVQPVPPDGRAQLLHGLLLDSVRVSVEVGGPDGRASAASGLPLGDQEEELVATMLLRHGTEVRLDTSPLVLEPAELAFFESLAPLLGDTPRRIKRFVNTCQLLFAMAPPLPSGGPFPSARAVASLVAAIGEGLPTVACHLLPELEASSPRNPWRSHELATRSPVTLSAFLASCPGVAKTEQERLDAWLAEHPEWLTVQLASFDVRLDMIRRLRFDRPSSP